MPQHLPRLATAALPSAATPVQAKELATRLIAAMSDLLTLLEAETTLVRAGNVRDAMKLEGKKAELSRHYAEALAYLKASHAYMVKATPDLLAALNRQHEIFRGMLQINLTVLATAHAVTEGIVRGVNAEMQRRSMPSTYTAYGQRAVAGPRHTTPIAVSRSL